MPKDSSGVIKYINAINLEDVIQEQEKPAEHQGNPEDYNKNIQSNRFHTRNNQTKMIFGNN